jgi:phage tail-like protein
VNNLSTTKSNYLKFLPSIFRGADEETVPFFEKFLKVFGKILTGINDKVLVNTEELQGISEIIDSIPKYFYPADAPIDFINWLSKCIGLVLKEDWSDTKKREVIRKIIPIYRMRGTKKGLEEYLNIYVTGGVSIKDNLAPLQIGTTSTVGVDTIIGGLPPYVFIVDIILAVPDPKAIQNMQKTVKDIIDKEKPVHTYYRINITVPTMQIGYFSHVGIDTLLW